MLSADAKRVLGFLVPEWEGFVPSAALRWREASGSQTAGNDLVEFLGLSAVAEYGAAADFATPDAVGSQSRRQVLAINEVLEGLPEPHAVGKSSCEAGDARLSKLILDEHFRPLGAIPIAQDDSGVRVYVDLETDAVGNSGRVFSFHPDGTYGYLSDSLSELIVRRFGLPRLVWFALGDESFDARLILEGLSRTALTIVGVLDRGEAVLVEFENERAVIRAQHDFRNMRSIAVSSSTPAPRIVEQISDRLTQPQALEHKGKLTFDWDSREIRLESSRMTAALFLLVAEARAFDEEIDYNVLRVVRPDAANRIAGISLVLWSEEHPGIQHDLIRELSKVVPEGVWREAFGHAGIAYPKNSLFSALRSIFR